MTCYHYHCHNHHNHSDNHNKQACWMRNKSEDER
jgi:hypothetical protein